MVTITWILEWLELCRQTLVWVAYEDTRSARGTGSVRQARIAYKDR
jgi:hypothetical protein